MTYARFVTLIAPALAACPDPQTRFDEFEDRVPDAGVAQALPDAAPLEELPDISGTFFMAFDPSVAPGTPFLFRWQISFTDHGDGTGTATILHQALTSMSRQPVGPMTTIRDIAVNRGGELVFAVDDLVIPGPANAVSGGEVQVDLSFNGRVDGPDRICGVMPVGGVVAPFAIDLGNSTWSAVRVGADDLGDTLPPAELKCPEPASPAYAGPADGGG